MGRPVVTPIATKVESRDRGSLAEWRFVAVSLLAFVALVLTTTLRHEPWRDEGDAWLAARDMTLPQLFHWSHYSGTPMLWYLAILPLAKMGLPYVSVQLLHALLAAVTALIVLALAPFSKLTRLAMSFGYLLSYEYAVVARNYALLTLLIVAVACCYRHRYRLPLLVGLLLALMCDASLHGVVIAGAIAVAWMTDALVRSQLNGRVICGGAIAAIGAITAMVQVLPQPLDRQTLPPAASPLQRCGLTVQRAAYPLLPADWSKPRPGASGRLITGQIILFQTLALATLGTLVFALRRQPSMLLALTVAIGGLEYLFCFVWYGGDRHAGMLWLAALMIVWIAKREDRSWHLSTVGNVLVGLSLTISCVVAAWFHVQDWRFAYSGSTEAANYLREHLELTDTVAAVSERTTDTLLPYLPGRAFWLADRRRFITYCRFDQTAAEGDATLPTDALATIRQSLPIDRHFVFVSTASLPDPQANRLQLVFQNQRPQFFHTEERFFIYRGIYDGEHVDRDASSAKFVAALIWSKLAPVSPVQSTRSLVAFGNVNDYRLWSNIPYFLSRAGLKAGFLTHALDLQDRDYARHQFWWRVRYLLTLREPINYQWSRTNLNNTWNLVPPEVRGGDFISLVQGFPGAWQTRKSGGSHSLFVDSSLMQYWLKQPKLTRRQKEIKALETETYQSAKFVIAMASETARALKELYPIDPKKVFTIRAGANLHDEAVDAYRAANPTPRWRRDEPFTAQQPAVLGMIANDYIRKGLPKLVAVAEVLAARGRPIKVCVIGNCSDELRANPLVDAPGFIQKTDEPAFLKRLDSFAMGCLLSSVEPLGIGTLEALRLGIPVLGNRIGGIPDCVPSDAGFVVEPTATPEEIADVLEPNLFDQDRYAALCRAAESHANDVTWSATIRRMQQLWSTGSLD